MDVSRWPIAATYRVFDHCAHQLPGGADIVAESAAIQHVKVPDTVTIAERGSRGWSRMSVARTVTPRSPARRKYIDDLTFPGMLYGATIRSTIPCGRIAAPSHLAAGRLHRRRPPRHPRAEHRRADRRRSAVPGASEIRHVAEPILLLAHADEHALLDADKRVTIDYRRRLAELRSANASDVCFKTIAIDKGDIDAGFAAADRRDRGRVPHRPSGAALHRDQRRRSPCRATAA